MQGQRRMSFARVWLAACKCHDDLAGSPLMTVFLAPRNLILRLFLATMPKFVLKFLHSAIPCHLKVFVVFLVFRGRENSH